MSAQALVEDIVLIPELKSKPFFTPEGYQEFYWWYVDHMEAWRKAEAKRIAESRCATS